MSSPPPALPCAPLIAVCLALTACVVRDEVRPVRARVAAGVDRVHAVILLLSRGPDFQLEEEYGDDQRSLVRGRLPGPGDQAVTIRSLRVTPSLCTVTIQPGPFGDRQRAEALLATIRTRLEVEAETTSPSPQALEEIR